jgi:hypothetical protein
MRVAKQVKTAAQVATAAIVHRVPERTIAAELRSTRITTRGVHLL